METLERHSEVEEESNKTLGERWRELYGNITELRKKEADLLAGELEGVTNFSAEVEKVGREIGRAFAHLRKFELELQSQEDGWIFDMKNGAAYKLSLRRSEKGHSVLDLDDVAYRNGRGSLRPASWYGRLRSIPEELRPIVAENFTFGANGEIKERYSDIPETEDSAHFEDDKEKE